MDETRVRRIDLQQTTDLEADIVNICDVQLGNGFGLASSFVVGIDEPQLVLVFQPRR